MDAPLDPAELSDALWRLRLRGTAAADGLEAHRRAKEARELMAERSNPWGLVAERILTEHDLDQYGPWTQP